MSDSKQLPGDKNFPTEIHSRAERGFFDLIDTQFEVLYQEALAKNELKKSGKTASADTAGMKNTSCHETKCDALTRAVTMKPELNTSSPTLSVRERYHSKSRSPLKSRRLSLNNTYPVARETDLSHVSPAKSERLSLVASKEAFTTSLPWSKTQHLNLSVSSKKNTSLDNDVFNKESQVDQTSTSFPVISVRLSAISNQSYMPSTLETSIPSCDTSKYPPNKPAARQFDSNHPIKIDKKLPRTATSAHDNKSNAISDHHMTKPLEANRQTVAQAKDKSGPKSKRLKTNEQGNEMCENTSTAKQSDKNSTDKRKPKKRSNVTHEKLQHQDSDHQGLMKRTKENVQIRHKYSGACKRSLTRVKNDSGASRPSSGSESQNGGEKKGGFVYSTSEETDNTKSSRRQTIDTDNQVHSAGNQISSVLELDEAIPLQSMKSSRMPDRPIWSSILSQFKQ